MINLIKKKYLLIISLIILIGVLIKTDFLRNLPSKISTAQAVGDLTVNWGVLQGQPVFLINNILPGNIENRKVIITNNASIGRPIAIKGIKTDETGSLKDILEIIISDNGNDLYGGSLGTKSLTQFFTESQNPEGIFLFNLNPGASKEITLTVKFPSSAGNAYQKTKVIFDIEIGISFTIPEECRNIKFDRIIFGTQKDDVLIGGNSNDLILGFEGNDRINGTNGNDCLIGGLGNDRIDGSNGKDLIFGNEGNDYLNGSNGDDLITAGSGDDIIDGSNGNDRIFGNEGNDRVEGSNGNDQILGGDGRDSANGGLGTDSCEAETKTKCER